MRIWYLANAKCVHCNGLGHLFGIGDPRQIICNCVWRSLFRSAMLHWRRIQHKSYYRVLIKNRSNGPFAELVDVDWCADFENLAKRIFDPWHLWIFRTHYLRGGNHWDSHNSKGQYYHACYKIEQSMGRELFNLNIWPVSKYYDVNLTTTYKAALCPVSIHSSMHFSCGRWLNGGYWEEYRNSDQYKPVPLRPPMKSQSDKTKDQPGFNQGIIQVV